MEVGLEVPDGSHSYWAQQLERYGTPVLVSNGGHDPLVSVKETERLVSLLSTAGAEVTLVMQPVGHQLIQEDIEAAKKRL